MAIPTQQYMKLAGGTGTSVSNIYTDGSTTPNLIKVGDTLNISGTKDNDGIYTVGDITTNSDDVYYVLKGKTITTEASGFTDATCDYNDASTIAHNANVLIVAGLYVSGSGIPAGAYVKSITSSTSFELSANTTGGDLTDQTLTFTRQPIINVQRAPGDKLFAFGRNDEISNVPYGVDVWSYNTISNPASQNDGWTQSAINPTFSGNDAKYIFHFADEALRICNINEQNSSMIKWYGYIERNQFKDDVGLSFSEWQEHPNTLSPPAVGINSTSKEAYSFGYTTSSHSASTGNNYCKNNRGCAYVVKRGSTELLLDGAVTIGTQLFVFDDGTTDTVDQSFPGEVITLDSALNSATQIPIEFMMCIKPALDETSIKFLRGYGTDGIGIHHADNETPVAVRGAAFNVGVDEHADSGLWPSNSWEFYQTFIYDGNQESLPVQMSDGVAAGSIDGGFLNNTTGNLALEVSTYWDLAYNGRISGGRVYIREKGSNDPLTLFLDADIVKGARTSMLDDHTPWQYQAGLGFYVLSLKSIGPSIDTYTSLNGFSSEEGFISIGTYGEIYKASTISGRRSFIANIKLRDRESKLRKYGDRIMYSEINKFDTFLESNFIDVSKGDFGEYVALESFADRLIAFKHNLVHIINISNPNPSAWFLEETISKFGISYSFSVTKTEFGIAWVNESGCFIYDGDRVSNLIEKKIGISEVTIGSSESWNYFINGSANVKDAMVGYDAVSNTLIVMRSPNDASDYSNYSFIYDFDSGGWTVNIGMFVENRYYTNFAHDWNNNLVIAREVDDNDDDAIELQKYLPVSYPLSNQELITRDIDFGEPGIIKKVYSVTVTYKSTVAQTTPFEYAVDGKKIFSDFTGDFSTTFTNASALNGGINATVTSATVDDGGLYSVGDTILIGTEQMMVNSIKGNGLTCSRAHNGTTADSHSDGAAVRTLQWDVATITPSSPISCQSIQLKFNPPSVGNVEINDITIEWRALRVKAVS